MTETKYIVTPESKEVNDALNRLSMILYILKDERKELAEQMQHDLVIVQRFATKYAYFEEEHE